MSEDPKALWQHQTPEGTEMNFERMRAQVQSDQSRSQRGRRLLILETLAGASLSGYLAYSAASGMLRFGLALLAAGFVAFLVLGWRRLLRAPLDTADACVAFLSKRLAQRRDAARGGWIVRAAPLLPGLGVTFIALGLTSDKPVSQLAPIATLFLVWIGAMLIIQAREARTVDVEIAQLDQLISK
jgi:hypothetical protein